ncbi:hypothetical protein HRbin01_00078 [archaeon HR01]|nr:hypothetical protein HRbin01_00078 [archaeon HR01]
MGEEDHWVIRIPKPKRVLRALSKALKAFAGSQITLDIPLVVFTSGLLAVVSFLLFTLALKIPDLVSLVFSAVLVVIYLVSVLSQFKR